MNFSSNSDYEVISQNEATSIICRFTPEMIDDIVDEALNTKYRSYSPVLSNIVDVIENTYKLAATGIPEFTSEINSQRNDIYIQIINKVCNFHNITFLNDMAEDIVSAAHIIYDFFIARFNIYLVNFFVNYINREKSMIYETLELVTKKKEIPQYSKKLYKNNNSKLAVIHANLEFVLENICSYDISFELFCDLAFGANKNASRYLLRILQDNGDFFIRIVVPYFKANFAQITTQIKFGLQGLASVEFNDLV